MSAEKGRGISAPAGRGARRSGSTQGRLPRDARARAPQSAERADDVAGDRRPVAVAERASRATRARSPSGRRRTSPDGQRPPRGVARHTRQDHTGPDAARPWQRAPEVAAEIQERPSTSARRRCGCPCRATPFRSMAIGSGSGRCSRTCSRTRARQPRGQRRQSRARRRAGERPIGRSRDHLGSRPGHRGGAARAHLRPVLPGPAHRSAYRRRARHRPDAGAGARHDARRLGLGQERGPREGQPVRGPAPARPELVVASGRTTVRPSSGAGDDPKRADDSHRRGQRRCAGVARNAVPKLGLRRGDRRQRNRGSRPPARAAAACVARRHRTAGHRWLRGGAAGEAGSGGKKPDADRAHRLRSTRPARQGAGLGIRSPHRQTGGSGLARGAPRRARADDRQAQRSVASGGGRVARGADNNDAAAASAASSEARSRIAAARTERRRASGLGRGKFSASRARYAPIGVDDRRHDAGGNDGSCVGAAGPPPAERPPDHGGRLEQRHGHLRSSSRQDAEPRSPGATGRAVRSRLHPVSAVQPEPRVAHDRAAPRHDGV